MSKKNLPWIEKYRINDINNMIGNDTVIYRIKTIINRKNINNLLLTGPSGCGKTSCLFCLANSIIPIQNRKDYILELNASDSRGIDIIRSKITLFCSKKTSNNKLKLILFDEADYINDSAQHSLRQLLEKYGESTKFIFVSNNSNKIIEKIQSRCEILKFNKINNTDMITYIEKICKLENLSYDDQAIFKIVSFSNGDLRCAINYLETIYLGANEITNKTMFNVCDFPSPYEIEQIINYCINQQFNKASQQIINLSNEGYSYIDILNTMYITIKNKKNISEKIRLKYIEIIGFIYTRIIDGVDTQLQLSNLCAKLSYPIYE